MGGQKMPTKRSKSNRNELRLGSRRTPASSEDGDEAAQHEATRPRGKRHDETMEHTKNRFLLALSGQLPTPDNVKCPETKTNDGIGDDNDNDEADTTTRLLTKLAKTTDGLIVTPAASYSHWFHRHQRSLPIAKRWSEELKQQEAAGLFVDEQRKQFKRLEHSMLDRLEERLYRELTAASSREWEGQSTGTFIERLLYPQSQDFMLKSSLPADENVNDTATEESTIKSRETHEKQQKAPSLAVLELYIDRVVLDDHPSFALADRLAAQLRALYTAYSRLQQLQPWQLSLQRLEDFFCRRTHKLAQATPSSVSTAINLSTKQVTQEINQLLTDVEALDQLHHQILSKANEMREAGTRAGADIPLRVQQRQRMQPIDLSRVEAVLELLESDIDRPQGEAQRNDDDKEQVEIKKILERLSTVSSISGSHSLQTVLHLESISKDDGCPNEVSFWSPRFYVALRVNGKIACTTGIQPWSRGEARFSEKFCFTLSFFPSSVCAEVYERRMFLRDEIVSTSAIPVVVPGHNVAKFAPSRARSSLIDGWGDKDADHLVPVASLTSSDEWYQFSSTTPITRTQWHRSFHNSPLFTRTSRHTQGRLHLRASWVSDTASHNSQIVHPRSHDTAYLPPKRPEIAGGHEVSTSPVQLIGKPLKRASTHLSQYLCDSDFSSERDFLRLVEPHELPLDPNDPENVAVRRLQIYYTQQQQEAQAVGLGGRRVFRTSDVPDPLTGSGRGLTKRNRLLRLRDREYVSRHGTSFCDAIASHDSGKAEPPRWIPQHVVFDEPLPLLEHEFLADARLLRLLRPELRAFDRRVLSEEAERADASIVERHRLRQLLKLRDFRERVRQTQIVTNYNTASSKREARADRSKPLAVIVQEKPLPLFPGSLELPAFGALFAPRRRLRPLARDPTNAVPSLQTAAHWPTACTLYVQVQKATNVPVRIKPPRNSAEAQEVATTGRRRRDTLHRTKKSPRVMTMPSFSDNQSEEGAETPRGDLALEYESHVFVQTNFQGKTRQTSCATITGPVGKSDDGIGSHPMWMETVALPFRPPQDDWSPDGIESTQDTIRFSLFDQVTRPASTTVQEDRHEGEERLGAQTRALHRENCFLGSLEVPFLTLYRAGHLEGSLRCHMPVEHLGYANLQVGIAHGSETNGAKASSDPASAASSDSEADSPRQHRTRGLALSSPTPKQKSQPTSPEASSIDDDDKDTEGLRVKQAAREATFLKLTLLLDPVLPVSNQASDHDEKEAWTSSTGNAQDKLLLAHAQRWTTRVRNATPPSAARRRNYNVFVRNLSHGATFLPRFLRAQSPPAELHSASLSTLVRYVSLIPFLDDWLAFDGDKDIWSTTQEFLSMGAGDHEEHAVLLANYFMWYNRRHRRKDGNQKSLKSYLVLGHAVPEGNMVYVLRGRVLWNASTGVGYAVSDPHCPLRDISLVVSSKNVFANVQPLTSASGAAAGSTHEFNWDFESNAKCWKPFFTAMNISIPPSVQRRELVYSDTSPEFIDQVERELREALKLAIRRWRSTHFVTTFSEAAGLQLREHLMVLEREANGQDKDQAEPSPADNNAQLSPRSTQKLKQKLKMKLMLPMRRVHPGSTVLRELQRSREVCGLPLHVSFTDIPRVLDLVENTNIHYNERPGVEFALAVYVCGHPNCVLSVWVYFAALVPL